MQINRFQVKLCSVLSHNQSILKHQLRLVSFQCTIKYGQRRILHRVGSCCADTVANIPQRCDLDRVADVRHVFGSGVVISINNTSEISLTSIRNVC